MSENVALLVEDCTFNWAPDGFQVKDLDLRVGKVKLNSFCSNIKILLGIIIFFKSLNCYNFT
jgi:hypothetical protein